MTTEKNRQKIIEALMDLAASEPWAEVTMPAIAKAASVKLEVLRREHRDLDDAIHALDDSGRADQLRLRRLKKQKLHLKDQIAQIEDELTPDIIA